MMSGTSSTSTAVMDVCPICKRAALQTNDQNEKYCIMCGYKVPPYTENILLKSDIYMGTLDCPAYYPTKPKLCDDGIYLPLVDSVREGEEPYYKLVMSKDMFIEAYIRWVVPLLPSLEEHLKGEK